MEIYLVQHADAKPKEQDHERPLNEKGEEEAERVAEGLGKVGIRAKTIMHSGKLRAKQTAEIFARHVGPSEVEEMPGIAPLDGPEAAREFLESAKEPVMIVGHLPHLSRLASLLIIQNPEHETVAFRMGGALCLEGEAGAWKVKWMLTPEITPFPIKELFPRGNSGKRA
jgi:phosphohistidine phosphatase